MIFILKLYLLLHRDAQDHQDTGLSPLFTASIFCTAINRGKQERMWEIVLFGAHGAYAARTGKSQGDDCKCNVCVIWIW